VSLALAGARPRQPEARPVTATARFLHRPEADTRDDQAIAALLAEAVWRDLRVLNDGAGARYVFYSTSGGDVLSPEELALYYSRLPRWLFLCWFSALVLGTGGFALLLGWMPVTGATLDHEFSRLACRARPRWVVAAMRLVTVAAAPLGRRRSARRARSRTRRRTVARGGDSGDPDPEPPGSLAHLARPVRP
jgi:hypothetical protein